MENTAKVDVRLLSDRDVTVAYLSVIPRVGDVVFSSWHRPLGRDGQPTESLVQRRYRVVEVEHWVEGSRGDIPRSLPNGTYAYVVKDPCDRRANKVSCEDAQWGRTIPATDSEGA